MKKTKALPKNIRERTTRLLKMAGSLASQELLKRIRAEKDGIDSLLSVAQIKIITHELGNLKGAAMKLGQMLALEARDYFPEEVCVILDQLQSNVSFLDYETIDEVLVSELGALRGDLRELSKQPFAAASIGQVHSAFLPTGENVAVKVQYPNIANSIQSDVKIISGLFKTIAIMMRKDINLTPLVRELTEIFLQESDYLKEAHFTELYGQQARQVPGLDVPLVQNKYCTKKVLTLSMKQGVKFSEWIKSKDATPELRKYYGELILDLYTREFCDWGLVQTDPNLGNFLFQSKDRKLVLLDFGATKLYDLEFRKKYSQLICSVLEKDTGKMMELSEEMGLIHPDESPEAQGVFKKLLFQSMAPIVLDTYDFSETDYPEEMRKLSRELVKVLRYSPPPKNLIFLHRKLSGIFYILRQLKVELSLKSYTEKFQKLAV